MSLIFCEIVLCIIRQDYGVADDDIVGSLEKTILESMIFKCTNDGQNKKILKTKTALCKHGASLIQVIGNYQLNSYLETLTGILCAYICPVNNHLSDATT